MPGCAAVYCTNRPEKGFRVFKFPLNDKSRLKKWIITSGREFGARGPGSGAYLCEVHFEESQFETGRQDGRKLLKPNAVPTLVTLPKQLSEVQRKRKRTKKLPQPEKCKKLETKITQNPLPDSDSIPPESADHCYSKFSSTDCVSDERIQERNEPLKQYEIIQHDSSIQDDDDEMQETSHSSIQELLETIERLEENNSILKSLLDSERKNIKLLMKKKSVVEQNCKRLFRKDQMLILSKENSKDFQWVKGTIKDALELWFSCGSTGYKEILRKGLPYPPLRTLRQSLESNDFAPGILHSILDILKLKVAFMSEKECLCCLIVEEIALEPKTVFDPEMEQTIGYVTLGPDFQETATHALVLMASGLYSRWKQTVAYFLTSDATSGDFLKKIVFDVISALGKIGLHVIAVSSDMGSPNQGLWNAFGLVSSRLSKKTFSVKHPCQPNCELFLLPSVPHLINSLRNHLLRGDEIVLPQSFVEKYNLPSHVVSVEHIKRLHEDDNSREFNVAFHLREKVLVPGYCDKLVMPLASHFFSNSIIDGIDFLIEEKKLPESARTTTWFIKQMNKWFSLAFSRIASYAFKSLEQEKRLDASSFMKDMIELFEQAKIGPKGTWKLVQAGIVLATHCLLEIQELVIEKGGFQFLLTSRLTQDSLESLFSILCPRSRHSTPLEVRKKLKLITVAQILKEPSLSNCDFESDAEILGDLLVPLRKNSKCEIESEEDTLQQNGLQNISEEVHEHLLD